MNDWFLNVFVTVEAGKVFLLCFVKRNKRDLMVHHIEIESVFSLHQLSLGFKDTISLLAILADAKIYLVSFML